MTTTLLPIEYAQDRGELEARDALATLNALVRWADHYSLNLTNAHIYMNPLGATVTLFQDSLGVGDFAAIERAVDGRRLTLVGYGTVYAYTSSANWTDPTGTNYSWQVEVLEARELRG